MGRFFYSQAMMHKKVLDPMRFDAELPGLQPPTQRRDTQGGVFNLLDQNGNRLELAR